MKMRDISLSSIASFLKPKEKSVKSIFGSDYKQAMLIKQGREQFVSLMKKGLNIPVVLL